MNCGRHMTNNWKILSALFAIFLFMLCYSDGMAQRTRAEEYPAVTYIVWRDTDITLTEVVLRFQNDRIFLQRASGRAIVKSILIDRIEKAQYSLSKDPPWPHRNDLSTAFFMDRKNWLIVQTDSDLTILHLDHGNYRAVLDAFEQRGIPVERLRAGQVSSQ
jgi:hypothetical protein